MVADREATLRSRRSPSRPFASLEGKPSAVKPYTELKSEPLVAFTATTTENGVIIKWRTATEVGNLGFTIYRSLSQDGPFLKIGWIYGAENSAMPIDYQVTDTNVEAGKTYFYYLEDIDIIGEKNKSGIIRAVVPSALPVPAAGVYLSKDKAAYWDGRDNFGEKVSSGVYFYTLQVERQRNPEGNGTDKFITTRKLVVVK